jgi:formamidopyrimidine-DNA glycosylase
MPELPDLTVYQRALEARLMGQPLTAFKRLNPFVVRSVSPSPETFVGKRIIGTERLGKRIVLCFEGDSFVVIHLMISGRFRWFDGPPKGLGKIGHAVWEFPNGHLVLTEASSKKRASIHFVEGYEAKESHRPSGVELSNINAPGFEETLKRTNRTVKRALTDPHTFAGIGNAYSDEILHAARLSPIKLTQSLSSNDCARLFNAVGETLELWTQRLLAEFGDRFPGPGQITAFRSDFAVHGKFGKPCPVCEKPVQRIVYADNETNYCAVCQNEGRILADRSLSRLLKDDWPRSFDELES